MLVLSHDTLEFSFPEVHAEAKMKVSFVRTLRIPDDGKTYPLPPGLGSFPLRHVDDFKDKVPAALPAKSLIATFLQHSGLCGAH